MTRSPLPPRRRTRRPLLLAVWLPALLALAVLLATSGPAGRAADRTAAAGAAAGDPAGAIPVLAAGDLRGEIKPCGCSPEGQMGGLPRRLTYLEQALGAAGDGGGRPPGAAPILVDLGNNFPEANAQGRHKIALIRALLSRFAPQAALPGPGEVALGVPRLEGGLPYVLSNDALGQAFPAVRTVERGGRRIGLYGYLSPQAVYQGPHSGLALRPADAALVAELRSRIGGRREDAAVLLFRGDDAELGTLARAGLFDLIVAGNPSDDETHQVTERVVEGRRLPQVPTKGQGVLRLALAPGAPAGARGGNGAGTGTGEIAVDWLTERYADHPAAAPAFAAYDEQVTALFFARLQTQERQREASPYAGAAACQGCHLAQHQVWAGSRHSRALATLERVGRQHDPECLACHVVGLERGGFLSEDLTPGLANVQCENCHGPARAHVALPTVRTGPVPAADASALERPAEPTCRTCHRGSHSPRFDFAVYWPKVIHDKTGLVRPAAPPESPAANAAATVAPR